MAELVDAADLKSVDRKVVGVQVPPWALLCNAGQECVNPCKYKEHRPISVARKQVRGIFKFVIQMHKRAYFGILNDSKMTAPEGGRGSLDSKPFSQRSVLTKKIFLFGRS